MKKYALIGIVLILIGIFVFAYQGFSFTAREKVADPDPAHVTIEKTKSISPTQQNTVSPVQRRPKKPTGLVILNVSKKTENDIIKE